eukprot:1360749-Amorphochlora_amoeboformis.AAC.1
MERKVSEPPHLLNPYASLLLLIHAHTSFCPGDNLVLANPTPNVYVEFRWRWGPRPGSPYTRGRGSTSHIFPIHFTNIPNPYPNSVAVRPN